ncbi:TIM barrel protein [Sporosarcina sp. FSL K6-1508]|uniref:TIM barrel protein n=1 Tax=Sporosarcina sp. FSL K6-1508 TaxID=2921553 RepID=UPI0030FB8A26
MQFSICYGAYPTKDVFYHLEKVKEHKLDGLEFYRWWNLDVVKVEKEINRIGVGFNSICTNYISLVNKSNREEYKSCLLKTIETAKRLGVRSIISQTGDFLPGVPREIQLSTMIETLKQCSSFCEESGIVLEIEPLNSLIDHKNYFLTKSSEAVEVIKNVDSPNIKICFDIYHQQISEGNIINNITEYFNYINHFHFADNPGRTEPGVGELNYSNILTTIKNNNFNGFIGLECKYTKNTDKCIDDFKQKYINKILKEKICII